MWISRIICRTGTRRPDSIHTSFSKQFNKDCQQHRHRMDHLFLGSSFVQSHNNSQEEEEVVEVEVRHGHCSWMYVNNEWTTSRTEKIQSYRSMIVKDSYQFGDLFFITFEFEQLTNTIQLDRIITLDLSHRSHVISMLWFSPIRPLLVCLAQLTRIRSVEQW